VVRDTGVLRHSGVGFVSFRRRPESRGPDLRQGDGVVVRATRGWSGRRGGGQGDEGGVVLPQCRSFSEVKLRYYGININPY